MTLAKDKGIASPTAMTKASRGFVTLVGSRIWGARIAELSARIGAQRIAGRVVQERHAIELAIDRLAAAAPAKPSEAERQVAGLAAEAVSVHAALSPAGRERFKAVLSAALCAEATLVPLFHLLRTAALNRGHGFAVRFAGLEDGASFDLLISRDGREAEVVARTISADEGRWVHKGDWFGLVDRINPDLQTWLAAHPGRYLLKMTLPDGLTGAAAQEDVHRKITALLSEERKADHSETAILRLDPLLYAQAQANAGVLLDRLKAQFGEEAHFAVTSSERSVFVMAARAGRENEVAAVLQRRLAELPCHLSGGRPGILAVFIEDTDRTEWTGLRERLQLEGATRNFLTAPEARPVIAVTCASRFEMLGQKEPVGARGGELRFRNPAHPMAKDAALAPAVLSQV